MLAQSDPIKRQTLYQESVIVKEVNKYWKITGLKVTKRSHNFNAIFIMQSLPPSEHDNIQDDFQGHLSTLFDACCIR